MTRNHLLTTAADAVPADPRPVPLFVSIDEWVRMTSMCRRSVYDRLASGELKARKVGTRVLIDVQAGLDWIRSHPAPQIRPSYNRKTAA